jgi:hypothetical protein
MPAAFTEALQKHQGTSDKRTAQAQQRFPLIEADDQPRSMRDPAVRERRRAMLDQRHMIELANFAERLRRPGVEVPDFDPLDGGIEARVLFLFEKPGPMTAVAGKGKNSSSGFVSRDNDDPTAEAVLNFMREAEIPRELTSSGT